MKRFFLFSSIAIFLGLAIWLCFDKNVKNFSLKGAVREKNVVISKGKGVDEIGKQLEEEGIISSRLFWDYYIWSSNLKSDLKAGEYKLSSWMTLKEIVEKISSGEEEKNKADVDKITIPEGYRNTKIVALLQQERPRLADEFETLANCRCLVQAVCECDKFSQKFFWLKEIPHGVDLEGYLFPDTYFLAKNETGESLAYKMLENFQKKITPLEKAKAQSGFSWHEIITLASIVEREAATKEDKKIVAGIFLNRLKADMPLQSCATIAYVKNEDKIKFSFEDTRLESPYNTYLNSGLPPGPIANPGLDAIEAVLFPTKTDYYFFLTNPDTHQMFYAKTIEEQSANKQKNGL